MKIGIMGIPRFMEALQAQLQNAGIESKKIPFSKVKAPFKMLDIDIIHCFYMPESTKFFKLAKILGKKTVLHWIGSDVLRVITDPGRREKALKTTKYVDLNMALSPWLKEELETLGIKSHVIPALPKNADFNVVSFPEQFTVLGYLPVFRHEFYGSEIIFKLAKEYPQIKFIIVTSAGKGEGKDVFPSIPNLEYRGYIKNMSVLYDEVTVLVRIPEHDGQSIMVLEALAKGRHVIYKYAFPGCQKAVDYQEVKDIIDRMLKKTELNIEGSEYIKKEFNEKVVTENIINLYKGLLSDK